MENFQRMIYQEHASNPNTLGILVVEKTQFDRPITDEFDSILLIIVENQEVDWFVKHYEVKGQTVAMHIVTRSILMDWIDTSGYRRAAEWVIYGRKVYDRNEFIKGLKDELQSFPEDKRTLRKIIDFGKLLKNFSEGKALYESKEVMDSYSKILNALHYLARLYAIYLNFSSRKSCIKSRISAIKQKMTGDSTRALINTISSHFFTYLKSLILPHAAPCRHCMYHKLPGDDD